MNKSLQQVNGTFHPSEAMLIATLNAIGDAVVVTDAKGYVTFLNPVAEQYTGWTQAEAIDCLVDDIFHIIDKETRQPVTSPFAETLARGTIKLLARQIIIIARNGSEFAIADSCEPIIDCNAQIIGAVMVLHDATAEHALQQALTHSENKYQQLFENSHDALMLIVPPSWHFTEMNRAARRLFRISCKVNLPLIRPCDVSPERQPDGRLSAEKAQEMIANTLRKGGHFFEWEHQTLDGKPFAADVLLTRIGSTDNFQVQATVRNISKRKRDEVILRV